MLEIIYKDFQNFILPAIFINLFIGVISFPLANNLFKNFKDKGYAVGHIIGYLSLTFIYFLLISLSSLIFKEQNSFFTLNSAFTIITSFTIWFIFNHFLYQKSKISFDKNFYKNILLVEIIFAVAVLFYYFLNSFSPAIEVHGEKVMSLGFLNSLEIQKNLPIEDFWYSGETLNYYYFGHILGNFYFNLINTNASVGYFFLVTLIPGLIFPALFMFIFQLLTDNFENVSKTRKYLFSFIGVLIFAFISPIKSIFTIVDLWVFNKSINEIGTSIWDYSVRVIPSTIAENFNYGINYIPLHGHIFSLIIATAFLYTIYTFYIQKESYAVTNKYLILFGFLLGLTVMTNTWDVIFYLGLFYFLFVLFDTEYILKNYKNFIKTSLLFVWYIVITSLPWSYKFVSPGGIPGIVKNISFISDWVGLWGFFVIISIFGTLYIFKNSTSKNYKFIFGITIYAFLISLFLELIYFSDANSSGDWYRANTYYKFSNQAFYLLSIASSIFVFIIFKFSKNIAKIIISFLIILCFILNYFYFQLRSTNIEFSGIRDSTLTLKNYNSDFYEGVKFFKSLNLRNITIIEGSGYAYDNYNFVSTYTGHPTVLGWHNHQLTWRNSKKFSDDLMLRLSDVSEFYTGDSYEKAFNILYKYNVDYIVLSNSENLAYQNVNRKKVLSLGKPIFQNKAITILKVTK